MRILYQFPFSPYCEKARWLLDHKELTFVAKNQTPFLHRSRSYYYTQQFKLPILWDNKQYIFDSTHIAHYLEKSYPEYPLFYYSNSNDYTHSSSHTYNKQQDLNQRINELDIFSQQLGQSIKYWLYRHVILSSDSLGERGILRRFERISLPIMRQTLKHYSQRIPLTGINLEQQIRADCEIVRGYVQQSQSGYLVGNRLTLADIAICSMLAPLVMPPETPWQHLQTIDADNALYRSLDNDLLGDYVRRIYQQHRQARVDWRGV